MQERFDGFLNQVLSLAMLSHLEISPKPLTVDSVGSELGSIRRIKLSYFEK